MLNLITDHRRALHKIPETGFGLEKTRAYLLEALKPYPLTVELAEPNGIAAFMDFGAEETIAFRADMDALPMEEKTFLPFSSTHPGKNARLRTRRAHGHPACPD